VIRWIRAFAGMEAKLSSDSPSHTSHGPRGVVVWVRSNTWPMRWPNLPTDRLVTRFSNRPWFWNARHRLITFKSAGLALAGRGRRGARETSAGVTQVPYLLRQAVAFALLCAVAIPGLQELDQTAPGIAEALQVDHLRPETYDVLLETVAGVAGVFIGLYFTAVTAVAAAVYIRVPDDLRSLIIQDRIGSSYVAWVAITAGFSVVLLSIHAAADTMYPLAIPLVGLLATVSIFSFVALGRRAFDLADPTLLRESLARQFAAAVKPALEPNRGWDNPTTQEASSAAAGRAAQSLGTLVRIATRESHLQGESSRALVRTVARLLASYIRARNHIPTESKFWGERFDHANWYLADSIRVDTATATGTALDPKAVVDIGWAEDLMLVPLVAAIGASAGAAFGALNQLIACAGADARLECTGLPGPADIDAGLAKLWAGELSLSDGLAIAGI
jgi:hypothetical protein